jgi:hypothetical protein
MTDRSTDEPEVPLDPDETTMGLGPGEDDPDKAGDGRGVERDGPAAPNELAEAAEPNELAEAAYASDAEGVGEPGGEAASDLDESELEAAATAAEANQHAGTQVVAEDVGARPTPAGAAPRGAAKAPTSARAGGRTALEVDPALRIRDRASQVFVALTVVVFVAIFANAMLFGVGGALNTAPTPGLSASPVSSGSPAPSGSAAPSSSAAPATTAPPTSAAPSAS